MTAWRKVPLPIVSKKRSDHASLVTWLVALCIQNKVNFYETVVLFNVTWLLLLPTATSSP
jgi:hypothetical protein